MLDGDVGDRPSTSHQVEAALGITAGSMIAVALPALADAVALFWLFPGLDLWASRLLYTGNHAFVGSHSNALSVARDFFHAAFVLTCLMAAVGVIIASISRRGWLTLPFYKWLFLAICLSVGPGIVGAGLQDHWGRARPNDVVEFGGAKTFSSPIRPSDQCKTRCSFVSGDASSIFIIFFAAALMFGTWARTLIALGLSLGGAAGFVGMAQGAAFLSDVVFAGVLMALTAALTQLAFDSTRTASRSIRLSN
ncbi:MAG TPA: phosphatase PAP2 family protein [Hyphomicrobium sp.]|nr:phosphatase PAP2 family protein [Hyphomicrobium sp.]